MNKPTRLLSLAVLLLITLQGFAQTAKFTVSGTVKDNKTGETLIGTTVRVAELPGTGTATNEYGFYSLTIPQGTYHIITQYVGYLADTFTVDLSQNTAHNISLKDAASEIQVVVVSATKENAHVTDAEMGTEKLDIKELNKIPVLFGEKDILKTIQLLPGIQANGEGNGGFTVRGGAADQNLILLDEAPVYNASHLLGFFSTFNSDAIKDMTVYKGTEPAQYGGRLSSVLDVRMKEGNNKSYEADGSIGLISSKLSVEGPIVKDKGSFFVSGRRTYADLFTKLSSNEKTKQSSLYFYDLNAKANYHIGEKDVLFLSGYFGRDHLGLADNFGINWGNGTATLRWNHIVNSKLFSNTSFIFSDYDFTLDIESVGARFDINSHIRDYNVKQEFQYSPNTKHLLRFGFNTIYHIITPGKVTPKDTSSSIISLALQNRYSWENAIYASDDWKVATWLNINVGVRLSTFSVLGSGDFYILDNTANVLGGHDVVDTASYKNGQFVKTYINPEPRLSASFIINEFISIKASYNRNTQYLHLISNSTTTSPSDKWIPSNNNIKPEIADQFSLGYFQTFWKNRLEFSVEGYYKYMQNQVDYINGANITSNDAIESQLLSGGGRAYGVEFYLRKKSGKFTGWVSYTLSRTEKQIPGINNGSWYPAKQDRTHDISIVASYDITPKINVAATWVYYTGNAVTFPSGKYFVDQQVQWLYTERNGYRMPAYHRLDFGATFKLKDHKHFTNELVVGLYNAYGRENAYTIKFEQSDTDPSKTQAVQTSLFRWVPSIAWNFKIK